MRSIILSEAGTVNARIVGQPAVKIAEMAGVEVPEGTKILIGEVESVDISEPFAHEKLFSRSGPCTGPPVLTRPLRRRSALWRTAATATPPRCMSIRSRTRERKKWQSIRRP